MPCTAPSASASAVNDPVGVAPHRLGEVGRVEQLADGADRHGGGGRGRRSTTLAHVAAMPPRWTRSNVERPAVDAEPGEVSRRSSRGVGAGVDERAEQHVAGHPGGRGVDVGDLHGSVATLTGRAGDGAGGAEAVVDADDGDPAGARGVHRQQRGDAVERGAVADARRHGDDRRAR